MNRRASLHEAAGLAQKANELFSICDRENKGFIVKEDMRRLESHLGLNGEQLDSVFDALDQHGSGRLSLHQFIKGFEVLRKTSSHANEELLHDPDGEQFNQTLSEMSTVLYLDDEESIRELFLRIRRNNPELLSGFQTLLNKFSSEASKAHNEFRTLENVLQKKAVNHEEEIKRLHEEMEVQIMMEQQKILNEVRSKELKLKQYWERAIAEKDKQFQEMLKRHEETQGRLQHLNSMQVETVKERERLANDRDFLEQRLQEMEDNLMECQGHIEELHKKSREDKKQQSKVSVKLSEDIMKERETLVQQLNTLREINKRLKDEKDEKLGLHYMLGYGMEFKDTEEDESCPDAQYMNNRGRRKRGSLLSSYLPLHATANMSDMVDELDEYDMHRDDYSEDELERLNYHRDMSESQRLELAGDTGLPRGAFYGTASVFVETENMGNWGLPEETPGERAAPDGAPNETEFVEAREVEPRPPECMFKVIFVGDSGVGKSSLLHRLSRDSFQTNFAATIGVDYQFKNLEVDGSCVALQLWDTAGQERFRSITKQYFRKADGVVICYDVTSEASFLNLRDWMCSVESGTEEGTVKMILGNKCDLIQSGEQYKIVDRASAEELSDEFDCIFHEVSAKTGEQVADAFNELAFLLKDKEERDMRNAIRVSANIEKKATCCGISNPLK